MRAVQLELDFKQAIALALAEPEVADLQYLWDSFVPELIGLTQKEQLQMAGQALCDLAEVCQRRAELMWNEWQDLHNVEGPIPDEDFLAGLVQKTMFLDISELVRQPKSRKKVVDEGEDLGDSVAEEEPEEPMPVTLLEHDEDTLVWADTLRKWMRGKGVEEIGFPELTSGVGLSVVKVWLALLLCGFELRQEGEFYDARTIKILN